MIYLRTWLLFIRTILAAIFAPKSNNKYALAGRCLFNQSFVYKDKDKKSFMFFIKAYLRTLLLRKPQENNYSTIFSQGNVFLYEKHNSPSNQKDWLDHIYYFDKVRLNGAVWKDNLLVCLSAADKIFQVIFETLLFIFLLPICIFVPLKGSVGLIFFEYVELVNALNLLKKYNAKTVYYCSIYEKDSNISSIAMQREGIKVFKLTSLTPLSFWNKVIVAADRLILNDTNQEEELETLKDTIQVKNIDIWGPYNIMDVEGHYAKNLIDKHPKVIGFYSTAWYVRRLMGLLDIKNLLNNEETVKEYLAEYLRAHPDIKLLIYRHPKEKLPEYAKVVEENYNKHFAGLNYAMADPALISMHSFELADIGVAMFSTVIYERLYFGFKCIMMPFGEEGLKVPGKSINNIIAKDKADLFSKLDTFLNESTADYFKQIGLKKSPFVIEHNLF
jgi:hypothetical protein